MATELHRNSDNVRIFGDLRDAIWLAPVGTALPTSLEDDLPSPWIAVGWLSEDGITYEPSTDVEKFKAHQGGATVRTKVTSTEKTLGFTMLESNPLTRKIYENASDPVTVSEGVARMDLKESIGVVEFAAVVQNYDETPTGDVAEFMCIERLAIGERGETTLSNADIRGFEVTGDVLGQSYILTNAPSIVEAAQA